MVRIRRTIGALALAVAAAAGLVVIPAQAQVRSATTTTTTSGGACDTIRQTIRYIEAAYDEPTETVLAAPWRAASAIYQCGE